MIRRRISDDLSVYFYASSIFFILVNTNMLLERNLQEVAHLCRDKLKGTVQRKLRGVKSYINQKDFVSH
jgi:hypothetical protein